MDLRQKLLLISIILEQESDEEEDVNFNALPIEYQLTQQRFVFDIGRNVKGPHIKRDKMASLYTRIMSNPEICLTETFKVSRQQFLSLTETLRKDMIGNASNWGQKAVAPEHRVLLSLHKLTSGSSTRAIAELFQLSRSVVNKIFRQFLYAVILNLSDQIVFRNSEDMQRSSRQFERKALSKGAVWAPRLIGAVDGTLVNIPMQDSDPMAYISWKMSPSLNVMAVVDVQGRLTYVCVNAPGSCHDQGVFNTSKLEDSIPNGYMILGDAGHTQTEKVLTPFDRRSGRLSAKQKHFNKVHSALRMTVERAFGKLKEKFRILQRTIEFPELTTIYRIILSCFLLHNKFNFVNSDSATNTDALSEELTDGTVARESLRSVYIRQRTLNKMFPNNENL